MGVPTRYLLGGAGLYAGVATAAYIRVKTNQCPQVCEHAQKPDGQAFNALADTYDQQIGWDEKLMGITLLRWMLMRQAKVIELTYGPSKMFISNIVSLLYLQHLVPAKYTERCMHASEEFACRVMFWKSQPGQAETFLTTTTSKSTQSP
jgi:hypothetical protein